MNERRQPLAAIVAIGAVLAAFALAFGDRHGFEGDDVVMLFGIGNFDRVGPLDVYRYPWQPLAYELLALLARGLDSAFALMPIGNLAGVAGLVLLLALLARVLEGIPRAVGVAALLTLCVPELMTTALYFNSTALALPFFTGSLLVLNGVPRAPRPWPAAVAAGALASCACLVRLDFAAALPFAMAMACLWGGPRWRAALTAWCIGSATAALLFLAWKPGLPGAALAILNNYQAGEFADPGHYLLRTLVATRGPAIVVVVLLAMGYRRLRRRSGSAPGLRPGRSLALAALSLAPTLAPLPHLYSGKYLVPFLACALVLVAHAFAQAWHAASADERAWRDTMARPVQFSWLLLLATLVVGVPATAGSVGSMLTSAFARPRQIGTHDGPRSLGAYLAAARAIRHGQDRPPYVAFYGELAALVDACGSDVAVVMPSGPPYAVDAWSWSFLPVYLQQRGWHLEDFAMLQRARLGQPRSGRSATVNDARHAPPPAAGRVVLDLREVPASENYWVAALAWVQSARTPGADGVPRACAAAR